MSGSTRDHPRCEAVNPRYRVQYGTLCPSWPQEDEPPELYGNGPNPQP